MPTIMPNKRSLTIVFFLLTNVFYQSTFAHTDSAEHENSIETILAGQPDNAQQRYQFRNPKETLEFFNIKPGMTVIEVLPGDKGWYSKILLPFLGDNGTLIGADYPFNIWEHFSFMTPERLEAKKTWVTDWTALAKTWRTEHSAQIGAFQFENMPEQYSESVDAVLFIRALHNLNRVNDKGDFLGNTLKETYKALKPGGIVGIVQHEAREDRPDSWADGNNGYLKKSFVIKTMTEHGFEFVAQSNINANPKDQAGEGDRVWRLPPALSSKDPETKAAMKAIGESNRMTLLFKKP